MCGIVGYVGSKDAPPIVISGLQRLEYRGYDSAGLATLTRRSDGTSDLAIKRCEGKIENLLKRLKKDPIFGTTSIGHTRWATHGKPSERNAHPHRYGDIVIVHNGIIENYVELKEELRKKKHEFSSETDSEVIAHLLQLYIDETKDFEKACLKAVGRLKGAFALAAIWTKDSNRLFVAKQHCPLLIGLGKDEQFVASDIPALLEFTNEFIFLEDGECAFVEAHRVIIRDFKGNLIQHKPHRVNWSLAVAEKEGYPHFMLKEIHEQPRAVQDTLSGRIKSNFSGVEFDTVKWKNKDWKALKAVEIVACGSAWHASLLGKAWIEQIARLHCEVDLASEFRYRNPVALPSSLCVAVSQSGETADTLAAIAEAAKLKFRTLSITNSVESSLARKTKSVIYTHAGPEIAVASTKCFLAQMSVLALLGIRLAEVRATQSKAWIKKMLQDMAEIPEKIEELLKLDDHIRGIAQKFQKFDQYFYLGRGLSYPIALEGALKLKEIAYINTQAYPAGEMKHGPIALISNQWPVVCVAPDDRLLPKTVSNLEEVKARGGRLIVVGTKDNAALQATSEAFIGIPKIREELTPFLTVVALQLFSYHMAVLRGCDVDKPKNLAKSVTVE